MRTLNMVQLIGRSGADPETGTAKSGTPYAKFGLATNAGWKDKEGQYHEVTEWHNVIAWGKLAELVARFVAKGKLIYLAGSLKTSKGEKDGQKYQRTDIVMNDFQLLEATQPVAADAPGEIPGALITPDDDDIPF